MVRHGFVIFVFGDQVLVVLLNEAAPHGCDVPAATTSFLCISGHLSLEFGDPSVDLFIGPVFGAEGELDTVVHTS